MCPWKEDIEKEGEEREEAIVFLKLQNQKTVFFFFMRHYEFYICFVSPSPLLTKEDSIINWHFLLNIN